MSKSSELFLINNTEGKKYGNGIQFCSPLKRREPYGEKMGPGSKEDDAVITMMTVTSRELCVTYITLFYPHRNFMTFIIRQDFW